LPEAPRSTPWPEADAILASTASPAIPSRTFPLAGARGDGAGDDTLALQRAIDGCHASGGGHVVVPSGVFLTGALRMRSRVDLNLSAGATLLFSADSARFPPVRTRYEGLECVNRSPMLYAWDESDVAVTGRGRLDASRTAAWNRGSDREGVLEPMVARGLPPDERLVVGRLRTAMVETIACARVLIQGVTLAGAQFWQLHPTLCTDVTIDGVTTSDSGPNSDGCNPESCERVVIRRCTFASGDDDIALKSGRDEDGRRLAAPCRNVVIVGCQAEGPYGFLASGSEQGGGVENVYAFGNHTFGSGVGSALWLKSNSRCGGFTRNVNLSGFQGRVWRAVAFATMKYDGQSGSFPPVLDGVHIDHVAVDGAHEVLDLNGLATSRIRDFTVSDSRFTGVIAEDHVRHAEVALRRVSVNGLPVR
jgi:polygalacturonase